MNKGIAVAGDIILDVLKMIKEFPERHGLVQISEVSYSFGGAVNNTACDLAILDPNLPVKAVGIVGTDAEGDQVMGHLTSRPNLDTSRVLRMGRTAFTDVLTEEKSKARTFLTYNESNDRLSPEHIDIGSLDCDLFHIGYIMLLKELDSPDPQYGTKMARLLHDVQKAGILTSVDVVSEVSDRYQKLVPPSLKYTDYFIVNELESGRTVGMELRDEDGVLLLDRIPIVLKKLKEMGVRRWAIIHAPEGGFGLDETGRYVQVPSFDLPPGFIKGTVGAGDAFCAGALYAAYRGEKIEQAIEDGNAAAACSLREVGGTEGMDTIENVRKLAASLKQRPL